MYRSIWVLILLFVVNLVFARKIEVCKTCPVRTIRQAVEQAGDHDIVQVRKGVYTESNIEISKPLTIVSDENAVVDGEMKAGHIFKITGDGVTVKGMTIRNIGVSYTKEYAAIYISKVKNFSILSNTLNNVFFGILVEKAHHGVIRDNSIKSVPRDEAGSGNGVHLWHCSNISINNNNISGMRDGIYLEFVSESKILRNVCKNNLRYGLHFMFSDKDEYHYNFFTNNGAGVAVMYSKFIVMTNNRFYRNWGPSAYGLLLKEITDADILYNHFDENTTGIFLEGSSRINYLNNDFKKNGWALKVTGACYNNFFTSNNFLNNAFDISYQGGMNENNFDGNYWSSYSGYDLDRDGTGDIPFRPVKLFSYITNKTPESIVLLRSLFVDILNFSEKVSPVFTPDNLMDNSPKMRYIKHDKGK